MLAADASRERERSLESKNGGSDPTSTAAVIVTPEEFRIVSHSKEECVLRISNVSFETVLFRLLTTRPDRYFVKPTKGVIMPNATITVTVVLNPSVLADVTETDVKHDDFRLEYCVMQPNDVIGPRCSNVPTIIKARKQDRHVVHKKLLRCTLQLSPGVARKPGSAERPGSHTAAVAAAATPGDQRMGSAAHTGSGVSGEGSLSPHNTAAKMTGGSSSAGAVSTKTDLRELEQNTLAAKNRRQMTQQRHQRMKMKTVVVAVSALVALLSIWLMYSWM